jgi:superfamily II DNA/RNA helicase
VIHADPPAEHKAYTHRSGRTARGGADGTVVTVQTAAQVSEVRTLMRKAGVSPETSTAAPGSAILRSIAGPPARRPFRVAPVARTASAAPAASQPAASHSAGRGAAAASASYRGRRGRR